MTSLHWLQHKTTWLFAEILQWGLCSTGRFTNAQTRV